MCKILLVYYSMKDCSTPLRQLYQIWYPSPERLNSNVPLPGLFVSLGEQIGLKFWVRNLPPSIQSGSFLNYLPLKLIHVVMILKFSCWWRYWKGGNLISYFLMFLMPVHQDHEVGGPQFHLKTNSYKAHYMKHLFKEKGQATFNKWANAEPSEPGK